MVAVLPYCGTAPFPGELATRFNADPILIAALITAALIQWYWTKGSPSKRTWAIAGWGIAAAAFTSPLCALSVALFSARVGQHMILVLAAAPLIALAMPLRPLRSRAGLWGSTFALFIALWFWHFPVPYEVTFRSVSVYWAMHMSLFGSAIWLWSELLGHSRALTAEAFVAGALTSMHMGVLGALLSLANHPFFSAHFASTWAWGFTPLEDQQLGGVFMWVPGIALFLTVGMRSLARFWVSLDGARPA